MPGSGLSLERLSRIYPLSYKEPGIESNRDSQHPSGRVTRCHGFDYFEKAEMDRISSRDVSSIEAPGHDQSVAVAIAPCI